MDTGPLGDQIPEPELRDLYVRATLKQRYAAARSHLAGLAPAAQQVVMAVAALEGFARAVALHHRTGKGAELSLAYQKLKHEKPVALLEEVARSLPGGREALGDGSDWELVEQAVRFRHLLIHEATLLHGGSARALSDATARMFRRLGEAVGVAEPKPDLPDGPVCFIGVDLAWQSERNPTAVVVAHGMEEIRVATVSPPLVGIDRVFGFIQDHAGVDTVVAIDAPLIIQNQNGQRPCERQISHAFSRHHAGAHSSNRTKYPEASSVELADRLRKAGWTMEVQPEQARHRSGQWFFEVYPHPAQVTLFGLAQIIKYKKGRVADRREEMGRLVGLIGRELGRAEPRLVANELSRDLLERPIDPLKGRALKDHEDRLDALFCCYLAAHYWYWGATRNRMYGDFALGNIVVPSKRIGHV